MGAGLVGGFVPLSNRRFCLIIKIGDFVPFSKSAVLSHCKIGGFVSHPNEMVILQITKPK